MSTEPTAFVAAPGAPSPAQRLLIEALAKGSGRPGALRELLAHAPMAPDQRALIDLVLSAAQEEGQPPAAVTPEDTESEADAPRRGQRTSRAGQELADLREVNDTMAAALGACRACWGGDTACPECDGHGGAGSRTPDPALFRELVVPAVRRVRALRARAARSGIPPLARRRF